MQGSELDNAQLTYLHVPQISEHRKISYGHVIPCNVLGRRKISFQRVVGIRDPIYMTLIETSDRFLKKVGALKSKKKILILLFGFSKTIHRESKI